MSQAPPSEPMVSQASLFSALQPPVEEGGNEDWKSQLVDAASFFVLDLETTGLNAKRNAITEITVIRYVNGEATDIFSTLVQPKEPIPQEVEDLTGISNEMVKTAPPLIMVLNDVIQFVGAHPLLVGHNVNFDLTFLREKCRETGLLNGESVFSNERAFCSKVLAQKVLPGLPSYEGIVVATQCGYHNDNPHRAEADVRMSAAILFKLIEKLRAQGQSITTVESLRSYQGPIA